MTREDLRPVDEFLKIKGYSAKVKEFIFLYWMKVREQELLRTGSIPGVLIGNAVAAKEMLEFKNVECEIKNTIQINEDDGTKTYIVRIVTLESVGRGILCVLDENDVKGLKYKVDRIME